VLIIVTIAGCILELYRLSYALKANAMGLEPTSLPPMEKI